MTILPEAYRTWLFDLDDTLYPRSSGVFKAIEQRILEYLARHLAVDAAGAVAARARLVGDYGTTLRGLMIEHGIEPRLFTDYVHDVDLSVLVRHEVLDAALARLPGTKVIFTNGTSDHAERVLERLGLAHHFAAIFDIAAGGWVPKPSVATYRRLIDQFMVQPGKAIMLDDSPRNLATAKALGLATVWVTETVPDTVPEGIDAMTADLPGWLSALG
ncbi:MAG: pyrimidine 5'-nucleotidase [Ferrovibrionaceae bacterium]